MGNISYRCPNCGGEIGWDSGSKSFKCIYCSEEFAREDLVGINLSSLESEENVQHAVEVSEEESKFVETNDGTIGTQLVKYKCSNCQAELITEKSTAASICVYCGKPIIMTEQVIGDFSPKYIVPFEKTQEEAMNAFKAFMKKPLTPNNFVDSVTVDKVQGIYIPFWLFSGDVQMEAQFKSEKCTKETIRRSGNDRAIDRTWQVYNSYRRADVEFDGVPADGSKKTGDDAMQSIEPFDMSKAIEFDTAYLSGYLAERYDESADEVKDKIQNRLKDSAHDSLIDTVQFDRVETQDFKYDIKISQTDYVLLPTWLLYCTYNNKSYLFAMNGQTGKFIGNLPIDKKKLAIASIVTYVICMIILLIICG